MSYIAAEDVAKAKEMEKYITDERTGLKYELVGDYYLVVGDDEPEEDQPIRIWGQRHLRHLKRRHKVIYANLLTSGKLPEYLADMQDCKRLVDGFLLTGKIQIFGFAAILGLGNAKHPRIIQIRWEGLSVIIPYERRILVNKQQTVFGKNALAGSDQLSPELCIFRIVCIIGGQTALDREQILSADFAHVTDIPNQRIAIEIKTQIDEVGQSVEAL